MADMTPYSQNRTSLSDYALITSVRTGTGTIKSPARLLSCKALCSIRIHVISDSCYYHITPFSVQYHIFMNDIPDTCHCKSNHDTSLYRQTPLNNSVNLFHES